MRRDRPDAELVSTRRKILAAGCAGALMAALLIGILGYGAGRQGPTSVAAFTTTYDHRVLNDPLELLLVQSDGQAFASLARDPTLARPEVFRTDAEAAYRAQRPLVPYAAWALSLGQSGWVPPALAGLAAAGAGLAVAGVAQLLSDRRAPPLLAMLVLLFPGTYMALSYCGPEPLGLGLVTWGLVAWSRHRIGPAVALFAVAGLCRETLLLVPLALLLTALDRRRIREAAMLATSFTLYIGWVIVVRLRIGAWPTAASHGRLSTPFVGAIEALLHANVEALLYAALCLGGAAGARLIAPKDPLRTVVVAHVAFAAVMGRDVWISWGGFGRVLLPLNAVTLVMIAGKVFAKPPAAPAIRERDAATTGQLVGCAVAANAAAPARQVRSRWLVSRNRWSISRMTIPWANAHRA
jgi:hypothetical protein